MESITEFLPSWLPPWAAVALAGAGATQFERIKELFFKLTTHIVASVILDAELSAELINYLAKNGSYSKYGAQAYLVINEWSKTDRRKKWFLAKWLETSISTTMWIKHPKFGAVPVWLSRVQDGHLLSIRFIRGTLDIDSILRGFVEKANAGITGRFRVERLGGRGSHQSGEDRDRGGLSYGTSSPTFSRKPATCTFIDESIDNIGEDGSLGGMSDLYLEGGLADAAKEVRFWFNRRKWYEDHRIPWRRGVLLHGVPGTGKTSFARGIAIELDLPMFVLDLGSMTNDDIAKAHTVIVGSAPCMLLIEDIDSVYKGRVVLEPNPQLGTPPTFDSVLNLIQGADALAGAVLIVTCNNIEDVDWALGGKRTNIDSKDAILPEAFARPGRIDRVVETSASLTEEGRTFMANRIIGDLDPGSLPALVAGGANMTPAQYQEYLVQFVQNKLASEDHARII